MNDEVRRRELREFLTAARSRLAPGDVGLPATTRRRVPGLRREEVAELAGVTAVWYRWLESGRDMRVSEQFLERLSLALRLTPRDKLTLYRLALAGLYGAEHVVRGGRDPAPGAEVSTSAAASIVNVEDIDSAATAFAQDRERFLTCGSVTSPLTRTRILRSWGRSSALGVDSERHCVQYAARRDVEIAERREVCERVLRAGRDVLRYLSDRFCGTGYAVALTDASGCLLHLDAELQVRRRLAKFSFEPGGDWSESAAGTNAIGTAIADGRPIQLMGAEHFCAGWRYFTCTAAPIRDPDTGDCVAVLDVTGDYRLVRRYLVGAMLESALEIEEGLRELT